MNPVRAHDARFLQGQRDVVEIARIDAWKAAVEAARLQKLSDDLEALGFAGLGGGLTVQDVSNQINDSLTNYINSNALATALNSYVTSGALTLALSSYVTSGALTNALYDYVTEAERAQDLATFVSNAALTNALSNYVATGALAATLTGYVSTGVFNAALSSYVTSGALTTTLSSYATTSALNTALSGYVTSGALTTALQDFVTSSALTTALSNYVTTANLSANLTNYITSGALTTALASYVTSGALTTALSNYVTSSALTTALSNYVTSGSLTTTLSDYAKRGTSNTVQVTNEALNCTNVIMGGTGNLAMNCSNLTINAAQQDTVFENVNFSGFVCPLLPKNSIVRGLFGAALGKKLIIESGFSVTKTANANVIVTSGGIKPIFAFNSFSQPYENVAIHDIDVMSNQGFVRQKIYVRGSGEVVVMQTQTGGNLTINIVCTLNAADGKLNITLSLANPYNSNQLTMYVYVKSDYIVG